MQSILGFIVQDGRNGKLRRVFWHRPGKAAEPFAVAYDEGAFALLRYPEHMRGQARKIDVIVERAQPGADILPRPAPVMADKVWHIFDDEEARFLHTQNVDHVIDEVAPLGTLQAFLLASLGERLAGKACAQDIMIWDRRNIDAADIAVGLCAVVLLIQ